MTALHNIPYGNHVYFVRICGEGDPSALDFSLTWDDVDVFEETDTWVARQVIPVTENTDREELLLGALRIIDAENNYATFVSIDIVRKGENDEAIQVATLYGERGNEEGTFDTSVFDEGQEGLARQGEEQW